MSMNLVHREPDFENIARVLRCEAPMRDTLFEFFMNPDVYVEAAGPCPSGADDVGYLAYMIKVYAACGYMGDIMEDVIEDMKFDDRHSYEDKIIPVEEAYRRWGGRIAILGGLDVDFLIRSDEETIKQRARAMLDLARDKGGYALGSGNSIPAYIPKEHYFAMTSAVVE